MNVTATDTVDLIEEIKLSVGSQSTVQVCVCPSFTSLAKASELVEQSEVFTWSSEYELQPSGAYTGEVSAEMLRDLYVNFVILGHSERRQFYGETNQSINKILATIENNLKPIYCIGESLEEENGKTLEVVRKQVREGLENFPSEAIENLVLAYEPIWAIGTGKTATDEMAQEVHGDIEKYLQECLEMLLLQAYVFYYGGSMKPENAPGLLAQEDVDGGLIGGASLDAKSFIGIVEAALKI